MRNLSDNDIDKLFLQAAEDHRPPFEADDWEAMAKKLDAAGRTPGYLNWKWMSIPFIVVGIISLFTWMISTTPNPAENRNAGNAGNSGDSKKEQEAKAEGVPHQDDFNVVTDDVRQRQNRSAIQTLTSNQISLNEKVSQQQNNIQNGNYDAATRSLTNPVTHDNSLPVSESITRIDSESKPGSTGKELTDMIAQVTMNDSIRAQTIKDTHERSDREQKTFPRLALRAMVSPDYSSDRFQGSGKTGFNYGMEVQYFFTPNVSLSAGALWSRKYYTAEQTQYALFFVEDLSGDCYMWDIPLNVRYTFSPGRKLTMFASAGLSSYLMNDENYSFEVDTGYGRQQYTMNIKNGNSEWLKMINVSIGIQKRLNTNFAVQLEPFVKIPRSGIGEGKVELTSFGCFFALQYSFLPARK